MRLVRHPVLCNYYLTYRCNAKCNFCDIWERPSPYVNLENVAANLIDLKKLGVKVIDFTGGEPLLHQNLAEILTMAKNHGFITTITSNGLLYPKKANSLAGLIDMLHFSLDSAQRDQHNSMRGVNCFDAVMESIAIAKSLGEKPDILFTVFKDNMDQLAEVYEKISLPNNLVLIINPAFEYNDVEIGERISKKDIASLKKWSRKRMVYLNKAFLTLMEDGGNNTKAPVCKAGSSTIVISPENELLAPCYHLSTDQYKIDNNLMELHQSKKVQESLANAGRLPGCEGCTINCYMQPSFAVEINKYFWDALPSTLKYNKMKGTWKQLINS